MDIILQDGCKSCAYIQKYIHAILLSSSTLWQNVFSSTPFQIAFCGGHEFRSQIYMGFPLPVDRR